MRIAGIDIGATTTKIAFAGGDSLSFHKTPSNYQSIGELQRRLDLPWEKFACALPAPVKNHQLMATPPNLTMLPDIDPGAPLLNDGNAAAFGEFHARRLSSESLFMLSFGTGLGGGFIQAGTIAEGARGNFAEVGHFTLQPGGFPCGCGSAGCAEQYASSRFFHHRGLSATQDIQQPQHAVVLEEFIFHAACVINSVANLYDPHLIVIGGGLATVIQGQMGSLRSTAQSMSFGGRPLPALEAAIHGEYSAAIGLLEYARRHGEAP